MLSGAKELLAEQNELLAKGLVGIETALYKLDVQEPDPVAVEELSARLGEVETRTEKGAVRMEELRGLLRPVKRQLEDIEQSQGDRKAEIERSVQGVLADLEEIRRRLGLSDKCLARCGLKVTEISELEPKDAERQIDISALDEEISPLVGELEQRKDIEFAGLKSRAEDMLKRVREVDEEKPDAKALTSLDAELELLRTDVGLLTESSGVLVKNCEAVKQDAEEVLQKHQRKVLERNETIALANTVNDRLKEVDNEVGRVNDALNPAQELINAQRAGQQREMLQAMVNKERELQNQSDTKLKVLFERFDDITRDLSRMDTVVVTSDALHTKQKQLRALLIELQALEGLLHPEVGQALELLRKAEAALREERDADLSDLRRRAQAAA